MLDPRTPLSKAFRFLLIRVLVVALCLGGGFAWAYGAQNFFAFTGLSLTGTAPSTAPTAINGANSPVSSLLNGFKVSGGNTGYRITLCAPSGQTLSGGGAVNIYWFGPANLWSRNPSLDETVTVTATSCAGQPCQCQTFSDRRTSASFSGFIMPALNGVTTSGSTTASVYMESWGVAQ